MELYLCRAPWAPMPADYERAAEQFAHQTGLEPNQMEYLVVGRPEEEKAIDRIEWNDSHYTEKWKPAHLMRVMLLVMRH